MRVLLPEKMESRHLGELAALLTVVFWTVTALAFESASKRVGSLVVNVIRLGLAFLFLSLLSWFRRGQWFPSDAQADQWLWLSISGLIGFVLGDYSLFKSFELIGARITMLIQALVPPFTAFLGWLVLDEVLTLTHLVGMLITLIGIGLVVLVRSGGTRNGLSLWGLGFHFQGKGLVYALLGAVGQSTGLILSKQGMGDYDPFAASQIRVLAGVAGFVLVFSVLRRWHKVWDTFHDLKAMKWILIGAVFGPFLGVGFSLVAIQNTQAGIASTIMALVPVTIILPSYFIFHDKPKPREIIGALIAVAGVTFFFFF